MMFVKTFKGYEDRTAELDKTVNDWVVSQALNIKVIGINTMLSHESDARARSGDLIYTVVYQAAAPLA